MNSVLYNYKTVRGVHITDRDLAGAYLGQSLSEVSASLSAISSSLTKGIIPLLSADPAVCFK